MVIHEGDDKAVQYRILIEQDEDGIFVAVCPSLPGCVSQGKSRKEAVKNIQDAIKGYLASLKKHNEPITPSISQGIVGGDMYAIIPQTTRPRRSPFDVPGLSKGFSKQEIVEIIRESRKRA